MADRFDAWWNRGMPEHVHIAPQIRWPLILLALIVVVQLLLPSVVWMTVGVTLLGLYAAALIWVRTQAGALSVTRTRQGAVVVAGDTFGEEFRLVNESPLPLIWAEFDDDSQLPGYRPSRVVGCSARGSFRWRGEAVCERRGVYRLGPHRLVTADPLGLFRVTVDPSGAGSKSEMVLVYPRVVFLPPVQLPRGNTSGRDRRRRPLLGNLRSASVREYFPGDSLRHVHWPISAHQGRLMVTELDIEPSGDLWIVLDLDRAGHRGAGEQGTLETSIILAASLAAELLSGGERRAVGLLAAGAAGVILLSPHPGQAQLWQILAALAPVQPGEVALGELLHTSREVFGRGRTVVVITPGTKGEERSGGDEKTGSDGQRGSDWVTELVYLQGVGLASSVLLVVPGEAGDGEAQGVEGVRGVLARMDVPVQILYAGMKMRSALTFRRTRTVVRTTPTGGVVTYEVEEEVG